MDVWAFSATKLQRALRCCDRAVAKQALGINKTAQRPPFPVTGWRQTAPMLRGQDIYFTRHEENQELRKQDEQEEEEEEKERKKVTSKSRGEGMS